MIISDLDGWWKMNRWTHLQPSEVDIRQVAGIMRVSEERVRRALTASLSISNSLVIKLDCAGSVEKVLKIAQKYPGPNKFLQDAFIKRVSGFCRLRSPS